MLNAKGAQLPPIPYTDAYPEMWDLGAYYDAEEMTTPVTSIFDGNPLAPSEPIVRPPTEPPKKSHKTDRYARDQLNPNGFIPYKKIEEFCSKVGEM